MMGKMKELFMDLRMKSMSNYPTGAERDPNAPYNEPNYGLKECPICQGTGMDQYSDLNKCPECLGTGMIFCTSEDEVNDLSNEIESEEDAKREEKER